MAFGMLFGIDEGKIEDVIGSNLSQINTTLSDKSLSLNQKRDIIFSMLDQYFDYDLMSKLILGQHRSNLTQNQQTKFTQIFKDRLKTLFVDKLQTYVDETIRIKNLQKPKENRIFLNLEIVGSSEIYPVIIKFYQKNANDFFAYDIDILGISIIQTYKAQFDELSQNAAFSDITKRLELINIAKEDFKDKSST